MKKPLNYPNPCAGKPKKRAGAGVNGEILGNPAKALASGRKQCCPLSPSTSTQTHHSTVLNHYFAWISRISTEREAAFFWQRLLVLLAPKGQENEITLQSRPVENKQVPYSLVPIAIGIGPFVTTKGQEKLQLKHPP